MRSLIDICDFSVDQIATIVDLACEIADNPVKFSAVATGKTLATLFYEPSTRTRLSFESAMYGLGGHVLGFADGDTSSSSKGESMADTARVVSCYADIIAMRHPREGAAAVAAEHATVPVINAGDGGHCHPTQTLTDLVTIFREWGRLDHLRIGICGDLKYGRTVHSLIAAMSRYEGVSFVLISPEELKLPGYVKKDVLEANDIPYTQTANLEEVLPDLDILYMTRIQRERFDDPETYERLKDSYVLDAAKMALAAPGMRVLHPLPRVGEISPEIDGDARACYFRQVQNGKYARMALIMTLLGLAGASKGSAPEGEQPVREIHPELSCGNARCITAVEPALEPAFLRGKNGVLRCAYCETKVD